MPWRIAVDKEDHPGDGEFRPVTRVYGGTSEVMKTIVATHIDG